MLTQNHHFIRYLWFINSRNNSRRKVYTTCNISKLYGFKVKLFGRVQKLFSESIQGIFWLWSQVGPVYKSKAATLKEYLNNKNQSKIPKFNFLRFLSKELLMAYWETLSGSLATSTQVRISRTNDKSFRVYALVTRKF